MGVLPKAPVRKLIKGAGAERVSNAAVAALAYHLEKFATNSAKKAVDLAHHAGRKTVTEEDIELAV